MSRWLFFPTQGSAVTLDVSGTLSSQFGNGARDLSPTVTLPSGGGGIDFVALRGDGTPAWGVVLGFNSAADRTVFLASYPDDFAQLTWRDSLNNVDMTTTSGWSYETSNSSRLYIRSDQWSNWTGASWPSLLNATFTLTG